MAAKVGCIYLKYVLKTIEKRLFHSIFCSDIASRTDQSLTRWVHTVLTYLHICQLMVHNRTKDPYIHTFHHIHHHHHCCNRVPPRMELKQKNEGVYPQSDESLAMTFEE